MKVWKLSIAEGRLTLSPHWASFIVRLVMRERSYASDDGVIRAWVPFARFSVPWIRGTVFTLRRPGETKKLAEFGSIRGGEENSKITTALKAAGFNVITDDA